MKIGDYEVGVGDRVQIRSPQGQVLSGKVVMLNRGQACAVLNMGGPHGRPGIASAANIVAVKPAAKKAPGVLAALMSV